MMKNNPYVLIILITIVIDFLFFIINFNSFQYGAGAIAQFGIILLCIIMPSTPFYGGYYLWKKYNKNKDKKEKRSLSVEESFA